MCVCVCCRLAPKGMAWCGLGEQSYQSVCVYVCVHVCVCRHTCGYGMVCLCQSHLGSLGALVSLLRRLLMSPSRILCRFLKADSSSTCDTHTHTCTDTGPRVLRSQKCTPVQRTVDKLGLRAVKASTVCMYVCMCVCVCVCVNASRHEVQAVS